MSSDPPASTVEFHLYTLSELQNVSTLGWDTLQDSLQQNGTCPSDIFDSLAHYMRLSVNAFEHNVTDLSSLLKSLVDIFTISISLPEFLWRDKDATRKFRHAIVHYHSQIILFYDLFASMYDRLRYLMFLVATPPDADAASNRLYASGTDTSSFVPRRVSFSTGAEHIYHFDHQQPPRILERQRGINGLDNPQSEIHGVFFSKEHCSKIFAPTIVLSLSVSQKREKYRKCSPRKLIAPVTPYDAVKKYGLVPPRNNPYIILLTDVPRSHVVSNFVPLRIPYDI